MPNDSAPDTQALIAQLAQTELLQDADARILARIAASAAVMTLAPGDVLLTPEQINEHIYLLLDGRLAVHFGEIDSPAISELEPGVSVGEMSIIDGSLPSAFVLASTPCRVFPVHRTLVLELVEDANPVARNLLRQITRWVKTNKQHLMQARLRIDELTSHVNLDTLTGLYNRRWLDQALPRLLGDNTSLCLLMLDVDHFKQYNDTQGHQGGDQALIALANLLKTTLRPYDFAARYGGEEFIVILPNTSREEAVLVAERLREAAPTWPIHSKDGRSLPSITMSIGVAMSSGGSTREDLIAAADARLYRAKQNGRNRVEY